MQVGTPRRIFEESSVPLGAPRVVATWYDRSHHRFVALLGRPVGAPPPTLSELVEYHVMNPSANDLDATPANPAYGTRILPSTSSTPLLPALSIFRFRLPPTLATEQHQDSLPDNEDTLLSRRIPMDVQLSLDHKLMAIQLSPCLIRIVPVEAYHEPSRAACEDDDISVATATSTASSHHPNQKHWTIDLSIGNGEPVATSPYSLPPSRRQRNNHNLSVRHLKSGLSGNKNQHGQDLQASEEILPRGIVWSDHGGNSQDLVLVTNKSVLCYKISLQRNQMAATHAFPQKSQASSSPIRAVWWEPKTRTLLLGAIGAPGDCTNAAATKAALEQRSKNSRLVGTDANASLPTEILQLRAFQLRFPQSKNTSSTMKSDNVKLFPRLELPPPKRLPPYAVGLTRMSSSRCNGDDSPISSRMTPHFSSPENTDANDIGLIEPSEIWLLNIYGDVYAVELSHDHILGDSLKIILHLVDHATTSIIEFKTYTIEGFRMTQNDKESMVLSVLDNILFVSFRHSGKNLFLDIADKDNIYFVEALHPVVDTLESPHVAFLPPNLLLDPSGKGRLIPIALDIDKLASILPWAPSIVPFFLRRHASKLSHTFALWKLSELFDLPINHLEQRRTMDLMVQMYAAEAGALAWDWNATLQLLYSCSLLPPDAALRCHQADSIVAGRVARKRGSCRSILYQKEIIENILLANAMEAAKQNPIERSDRLHLILDFSSGWIGALERHRSPPCPALECLVFSILWNLGYEQELLRFLESRCLERVGNSRLMESVDPVVIDLGTIVLVKMMTAITEEVPFGGLQPDISGFRRLQQVVSLRRRVRSMVKTLFLGRVTDMSLTAAYLLAEGEVFEAMKLCSSHIQLSQERCPGKDSLKRLHGVTSIGGPCDGLVFAMAASLIHCKTENMERSSHTATCLRNFLAHWDPDTLSTILPSKSATSRASTSLDDSTIRNRKGRQALLLLDHRRLYQRRPSFQAALVERLSVHSGHAPTFLSSRQRLDWFHAKIGGVFD